MTHEPSTRADRAAHDVIGAAIEVHRHLGAGFLERAYEVALVHELGLRRIPFRQQVPVIVRYKDVPVGEYKLDLLVDEVLVVELKTVNEIGNPHIAQTLSYLRALNAEVGLILNFSRPAIRDRGIRRIVNSHFAPRCSVDG